MKVPDKIKKAIKKCAEYNNRAKLEEQVIQRWLEEHHLTEDTCTDVMKNMDDNFIDSCRIGYSPDEFIKDLENL